MRRRRALAAFAALPLAGCVDTAQLTVEGGSGPQPELPPPRSTWLPTVNIAEAVGWPPGARPTPAAGLVVQAYATGLAHPRWLHVLPNGDVLVAESDAPPKPEDGKGIRGFFTKQLMRKAGSGTPSANRISLLRDADGDGIAERREVFLDGVSSPFGMTLAGDTLYVAATDALLRVAYTRDALRASGRPERVCELPAGPINHHWTKNVIASPDGANLYVTVGSNSNAGENGLAAEEGRAAIWQVDARSGTHRLYASGLRNPNGMAWIEHDGARVLWTVVNERDELGSDLVPDYLTSVREGGFYGWPWSYWGAHVDARVQPPRPDLVARALVPDYGLGPHTACLGLASSAGAALPAPFSSGVFIGEHGSWNRRPRSGYRVVFVPFADGRPSGAPIDVLTGFLDGDGRARGRPVGVAIDGRGALLVADDVGGTVWRVSAAR